MTLTKAQSSAVTVLAGMLEARYHVASSAEAKRAEAVIEGFTLALVTLHGPARANAIREAAESYSLTQLLWGDVAA